MKQEHLQVRCQGNLLYLNKIQSCLFFCLNKRIEQNDSLRTHLTKKILFIPFNKVQCQDLYLERIFKCNLRISVIWKEIIYKYICMYKYMNKETVNCHVFHRSHSTFCLRHIIIPWIGDISLVFTIDFVYYSYPISCLENPVDRGASWAAVHRVAQSRTQLKRLSMHACIGEGNGNPLQYSCLENPSDRGAMWAAIYGVAQSWTRLKWLSSSSSSNIYVSILKKQRSCEQFELWKIISPVSGITSYEFQFYSINCWLVAFSQLSVAAAAKSLQSCPTLCDPVEGSPPGSPAPGILQARTLEWVAISFSNAWKWKVKRKSLSHVQLLVTPWTTAYQAPPSMGFSKQEYWSRVPLPSLSQLSSLS